MAPPRCDIDPPDFLFAFPPRFPPNGERTPAETKKAIKDIKELMFKLKCKKAGTTLKEALQFIVGEVHDALRKAAGKDDTDRTHDVSESAGYWLRMTRLGCFVMDKGYAIDMLVWKGRFCL